MSRPTASIDPRQTRKLRDSDTLQNRKRHHLYGAKEATCRIEGHIKKLDAAMGEDGPFQLVKFPCLGKCDGAPVMLVNKERVEHATVDKIDGLLGKYAKLPL